MTTKEKTLAKQMYVQLWRLVYPEKTKRFDRKARGRPEPSYPEPEVCEICGKPESCLYKKGQLFCLSTDHNHQTKKFRGWLCSKCNRALGLFGDSVKTLEKAFIYLKERGGNRDTLAKNMRTTQFSVTRKIDV